MDIITLEKFKASTSTLPEWYTDNVHQQVVVSVIEGKKLQACKYLRDIAIENVDSDKWSLTWCKTDVVDKILGLLRIVAENDLVDMAVNIINDEIQEDYNTVGLHHLLSFVPHEILINYVHAVQNTAPIPPKETGHNAVDRENREKYMKKLEKFKNKS